MHIGASRIQGPPGMDSLTAQSMRLGEIQLGAEQQTVRCEHEQFAAEIFEEVDGVLQPRLDEGCAPAQASLEGHARCRRSTPPQRRSAA